MSIDDSRIRQENRLPIGRVLGILETGHWVVGANGSLIGFGGGIDMKVKLLEHEGVDLSLFYRPKHGTAGDPASWGR